MTSLPPIPRRLQDLVETCFEDSEPILSVDEAGIEVLDEIRGSDAIPNQELVHQLLYLALYPPGPSKKEVKKVTKKRRNSSKQQVPDITAPERSVVLLALDTLYHFIRTNEAHHILATLPSYEHRPNDRSDTLQDNPLSFHATCIARAKHCWQTLMPEFILPSEHDSDPSQLVADHAWGVLEWLLEAFSKDSIDAGGKSVLLASQLPPVNDGPKVMVDIPLDIIASCFHEPLEMQKVECAAKLLELVRSIYLVVFAVTELDLHFKLVQLTKSNPPLLVPDRLVTEVCRRLSRMKPMGFSSLLMGITDTEFRFALTWMFISKHSIGDKGVKSSLPLQALPNTRPVKLPPVYTRPPIEEALKLLQLDANVQDQPQETEESEDDYLLTRLEQLTQHATAKLCILGALEGCVAVGEGQTWQSLVQSGVIRRIVEAGFKYGDASEKEVAAIRLNARAYVDCWERFQSRIGSESPSHGEDKEDKGTKSPFQDIHAIPRRTLLSLYSPVTATGADCDTVWARTVQHL
ncbi:5452_t:CDS:2 [Acaulospora colombiana]|uniref:5452_t:CDS:1 n=1 Tax=Acaulospora colombiana TaxID=27376 RepID=A0ACA9MB27_9GLOM|nr:5452_t:CDS:2 [Acaulospora colombiana]